MLKILPVTPGTIGASRLRISAKRLMLRPSLMGTVLTKVVKDSPLPVLEIEILETLVRDGHMLLVGVCNKATLASETK